MSLNLPNLVSRRLWSRFQKKNPGTYSGNAGRRRSPLQVLLLEGRIIPSATLVSSVLGGTALTAITGTVYDDLDQNGVKTSGENGIKGWQVYLDLDNSGTFNTDSTGTPEPSAITNIDGIFTIKNLIPGTYRVAEVVQSGWEATSPVSRDVVVLKDKLSKADFFNFSGGSITGTVWNDLNHDGVRATDLTSGAFTEPGLSGWNVFLDLNNNGAADSGEPATLSDANGQYTFSNLPAKDYEVTEVKPASWEVSVGYDIKQTAAVVARKVFVQDFANYSLTDGSIKGTIWNDLNADGVRQADSATGAFTEPGLANWTVFLDTNNNRTLDPGELSTLTDANGDYSFISLTAGDYEVTELLPAGWNLSPTFDNRQTVSVRVGEQSTASDFANFTISNGSIRGTVWNDLNRNSLRDVNLAGDFTDPGLANWSVYLDLNRNGILDAGEPSALTDANGQYAFPDRQVGDYEVREILPSGWEPSASFSDSYAVTVYSGTETIAHDFANFNITSATPGSVSGTIWNDLNGNGVRDTDPTTGAFTDPGLPGRIVFADLNSNGVLDTGEPQSTSGADGSYTISGINPGTVSVVEQSLTGWKSTVPISGVHTLALKNAENASGFDFGNDTVKNSTISGTVFADTNKDSLISTGERGISGITVYLDLNNNSTLDVGEPQTVTSSDLFYTPTVDEAGSYSFTHLAAGTYAVREVLAEKLSATPADQRVHSVTMVAAEDHPGVAFAAQYRPNEIHGVRFDDANGNHVRDVGETGISGDTVFVDLNRNNNLDPGEPSTVTSTDGSYQFSNLTPGAYVVRDVIPAGHEISYPTTTGGILWPLGVSNPAVGDVTPNSIMTSLAIGDVHRETVSITLPKTGALTNLVDVFLLFDDTGSFTNNSPIVRSAFPTIISQLQAALPGIDLGFGVGRFEEYGNYAWEYTDGRPFILNQPIVAASTPNYMSAIQSALDRTTPGYGGDQPETDIEALYQLVTGKGFDGNNNGTVTDSGAAGLVSTQLTPGASGDVPAFSSFQADPSGSVLPAAGNVGGAGFRTGALPIVLVATDTGFAFQPKGETNITGVGGISVPVSDFTQTSRPDTPFNSGAGIQETITGLNALGSLVIGLGTNAEHNLDPRQGLEAISKLTGAVNRSTTPIDNGTGTPIAPGDPLYFEIASGFGSSVANGVANAIQNAVTNVAVDVTLQASDPRVKIINHSGVRSGIGSGQTASFDVEFIGDGVPHRFDLQFVRSGTNVILGSIPVVIGTPITGNGYEFEDLAEGEIHTSVDFGARAASTSVTAPVIAFSSSSVTFDGTPHSAIASATGTDGLPVNGSFTFTYNGSATPPTNVGTYNVVATFTSNDANYSNTSANSTLTIWAATPSVVATGSTITFDGTSHSASALATGISGNEIAGSWTFSYNGSSTVPVNSGSYDVVATFTSSDPNYSNATGSTTLTIGTATPVVSVDLGTFTFDGLGHSATGTALGIGGSIISGTYSFTYNGSAVVPVNAGTYVVDAVFTSTDANYANGSATGSITINQATPIFSNLSTVSITQGSATATITGQISAGTISPVGESIVVMFNGVAQSAVITRNGTFSVTLATASLVAGNYPVTFSYAGDATNFSSASDGSSTLTVTAIANQIVAKGLNLTAIAGAPGIRTVASFANGLGDKSAYSATIVWGDGSTSAGTISGTNSTLVVTSSHTYGHSGTYTVHVTITDTLGLGSSATTTSTAKVVSLNLSAGRTKQAEFWKSTLGQKLLKSFNGGETHTELSNWLAVNFPNLYGASAGSSDVTGKTNSQVLAVLNDLWKTVGDGVAIQVLTTSLNVYASTISLGGTQGRLYGFAVSTTGFGARSYLIKSGAILGVPNRTKLNVYEMLLSVDSQASNGVLFSGNSRLQVQAKVLFDELNSI